MSKKFIIMSNSRCGSTWLVTAMNSLFDVNTDYEIKIPPITYKKQDIHYLFNFNFKNTFWNQLAKNNVLGTKLVLDPKAPDYNAIKSLLRGIDPNTKIIFLTRSLVDQSLSQFKSGFNHIRQKDFNKIDSNINKSILFEDVNQIHLDKIKFSLDDLEKLFSNVLIRLQGDLFIYSFILESRNPFLHVSYENLQSEWSKIKTFVGSEDSLEMKDATRTVKIIEDYDSNEIELRNLLSFMDTLRDNLISLDKPFFNISKKYLIKYLFLKESQSCFKKQAKQIIFQWKNYFKR